MLHHLWSCRIVSVTVVLISEPSLHLPGTPPTPRLKTVGAIKLDLRACSCEQRHGIVNTSADTAASETSDLLSSVWRGSDRSVFLATPGRLCSTFPSYPQLWHGLSAIIGTKYCAATCPVSLPFYVVPSNVPSPVTTDSGVPSLTTTGLRPALRRSASFCLLGLPLTGTLLPHV